MSHAVRRWSAGIAQRAWPLLVVAGVAFMAGCENGDGERGGLNQDKVDAAYANGNSIVWVQSDSDFWDVVAVRASGTLLGSDAGTFEIAPGRHTLSVTCENDPWRDQFGLQHDSSKISHSVSIDLEPRQGVHIVVDNTGAGNTFDLNVASYF